MVKTRNQVSTESATAGPTRESDRRPREQRVLRPRHGSRVISALRSPADFHDGETSSDDIVEFGEPHFFSSINVLGASAGAVVQWEHAQQGSEGRQGGEGQLILTAGGEAPFRRLQPQSRPENAENVMNIMMRSTEMELRRMTNPLMGLTAMRGRNDTHEVLAVPPVVYPRLRLTSPVLPSPLQPLRLPFATPIPRSANSRSTRSTAPPSYRSESTTPEQLQLETPQPQPQADLKNMIIEQCEKCGHGPCHSLSCAKWGGQQAPERDMEDLGGGGVRYHERMHVTMDPTPNHSEDEGEVSILMIEGGDIPRAKPRGRRGGQHGDGYPFGSRSPTDSSATSPRPPSDPNWTPQ